MDCELLNLLIYTFLKDILWNVNKARTRLLKSFSFTKNYERDSTKYCRNYERDTTKYCRNEIFILPERHFLFKVRLQ